MLSFLRSYWQLAAPPGWQLPTPEACMTEGAGVRVALLDSGIDLDCGQLRNATLQARDFTGTTLSADPHGHGTRNAGILVGRGQRRGLLPQCTLLVGKVLASGQSPQHTERALLRAIDWMAAEAVDIAVLPLGRTRSSAVIERGLMQLSEAGMQIYAAAGNCGPHMFLFPASMPTVTAVTAVDRQGTLLSWCCAATAVNCSAPGVDVPVYDARGCATATGSSPATVLAAGLAALRLSAKRRR